MANLKRRRTLKATTFEDFIKDRKFENPRTKNEVNFGTLPTEMQKKIRAEFAKKQKEEGSEAKKKFKSKKDIMSALEKDSRALKGADLSGMDLSKVGLEGVDLRGADLTGAKLKGADLSGAKLGGAKLKGADLSGAKLNNTNLKGMDLSGTNLTKADFYRSNLQGANLKGATLTGVEAHDCDFREADLTGVKAQGANLQGGKFKGAKLGEAKLGGALLGKTDLTGVDLKNADLKGADLEKAELKGADLTEAKLEGSNLKKSDLRGATLTGADLRKAEFNYDTDFSDADLKGADFTGSTEIVYFKQLAGSNVEGSKGLDPELTKGIKKRKGGPTIDEKEMKDREVIVNKVQERVNRTKAFNVEGLESLAQEIGKLRGKPEYVKEHKDLLDKLQKSIESKYSEKGDPKDLKKLFSKGRRASQIRTASKMLKQLNKEIADLKKEL